MKVVLHICCGTCAAGAARELLSDGHTVTGYFYNPNIHPREEYLRRLDAAEEAARRLGFDLAEGPYETDCWNAATESLRGEPEGGLRCSACYRVRLQRTVDFMTASGADAFTSTLTISPHKSAAEINRIGKEIGGSSFLLKDFKKKDGFKKTVELARAWGLYRQDYCGCSYSLEARRR
jgi:predicted adenine nucleotide alpha hydrolase (AANH) superfamily ATPase